MIDAVDRVGTGRLVARHELPRLTVQDPMRAGQDDGADLVHDLRRLGVDGQGPDVAPIHGQGAAPRDERRARVAHVPVQLVGRSILARRHIDSQRLGERVAADQWLHRLEVEERALFRPLALQKAPGDGPDHPVRLGVALFRDARTEVGRAVAIEILLVEGRGDLQVVVPGLRWSQPPLSEEVRPVVDHLEVAVHRHRVVSSRIHRAEVAEEWGDILPLQRLVSGDPTRQGLEVARRGEVRQPLGGEDERVVAIRPRGHVGEHLLVEVAEGDGDDVDLRARQLLEVRGAALQGLRDLRAREREDVHGDALEGSGRPRGAGDQRARSPEHSHTQAQTTFHRTPSTLSGCDRRRARPPRRALLGPFSASPSPAGSLRAVGTSERHVLGPDRRTGRGEVLRRESRVDPTRMPP